MNRFLVLTLAVVPASLVFGTGCKKVVPPVPEAGVIDAAVPDMDAGMDAAVDPTAMLDAAVVPLTTAVPTHVVAQGGPYQGSYKCFGNMTVTQAGSAVTARLFPGEAKNYSVLVCTVAGNECDGKVTAYSQGKAGEVRTASLKRSEKGDLTYRGQNETQPTLCRKN